MFTIFRIAALSAGTTVDSHNFSGANPPHSERRIAVIYAQAAVGPVTGGGVLWCLAGDFALRRCLRDGLCRDSAQRQSRYQRITHMAQPSTLRAPLQPAHAIINGDRKLEYARPRTAGAIEPSDEELRNPAIRAAYESSMRAARRAYLSPTDPTNGAEHLRYERD